MLNQCYLTNKLKSNLNLVTNPPSHPQTNKQVNIGVGASSNSEFIRLTIY